MGRTHYSPSAPAAGPGIGVANDTKSHDHSPQQATGGLKGWPLSFAQQRLWLLEQLEPGTALYNIPTAVRIDGQLNISALRRALNEVARRHESLRTRYSGKGEDARQFLESDVEVPFSIRDIPFATGAEMEKLVRQAISDEVNRPIDLTKGMLIRASVFRLEPRKHVLVLTIHHIAADEWSVRIIFDELGKLYGCYSQNLAAELPEPALQYVDFAAWQLDALTAEVLSSDLAFWRKAMAGSPPVLEIRGDKPQPPRPTFRGTVISRNMGTDLGNNLKRTAKEHEATTFMVLMAAFECLVHRYTGEEDLVIATPVASRNREELESAVGFFVNTLPLRVRVSGNSDFRQALERVRNSTLQLYEHQDTPLQKIVEALQPERSLSHLPFTKVMFVAQPNLMEKLRWGSVEAEFIEAETDTAKFDLTFGVQETSKGLIARIEFNTDSYSPEFISRMLAHYETLLAGALANPGSKVSALPLLTEAERTRIVLDWNRTTRNYPRTESIQSVFEAQARKTPKAVAVEYASQTLTYEELNERANQLARHLLQVGAAKGGLIGLCMTRSPEIVVAMLGIIKAGCAYVPVDAEYPPERIHFMLRDAEAACVVTQGALVKSLPQTGAKPVCIDTDWDLVSRHSKANPENSSHGESAAYVMYTSGSTGEPKGVVVLHRGVLRLVLNADYISLSASDRIAQVSNISFDAATFEIWGALLNGGRLVGFSSDTILSPPDLGHALKQKNITSMFLTSALFNQVAAEAPGAFSGLKTLIAGGEALDPVTVRKVLATHPPERLLNGYGPTENTTFTCCHVIKALPADAASVAIGSPIANTQVYILDRSGNPAPIGVPGELHAAGDGLAGGYWKRPELTAEKFVPNPFESASGSKKLYKTGDLARYLPDGSIEFLGRIDGQVKLRGFRIELGEIETALRKHPAVRDCAAIIAGDSAEKKRLIIYYVGARPSNADHASLRDYLRQRLPEYMVPSAFVQLEALPLTANGKLNRAALPMPDVTGKGPQSVATAPRDEVEQTLASIWQAVLGIPVVGIDDRFFDMGGHSLLAVRLISQIEKAFDRKLKLATVFQAQTIRELACVLREQTGERESSAVVEIQGRGARPRIFLVHGAGGGMFWGYINLSKHLGPEQPVYALRSRALDGLQEFETIGEMARAYVADLKVAQPAGPYYLGGYCFGGNVAYEMARQLEERGDEIALLLLLNCAPPNSSYTNFHFTPAWCGRFIKNTVYWGKYFSQWTPSQRRDFFRWKRERWAARLGLGPKNQSAAGEVDVGDMIDLAVFSPDERKAWEAHIRALLAYKPKPINARVHLIRSPGHPLWCAFLPDYGWGSLARGGVDGRIVPGAHEKVLEEPCVKIVAAEVEKIMAEQDVVRMETEKRAGVMIPARKNTVTEKPRGDDAAYWKTLLADCPALLQLPADFSRPATQSRSAQIVGSATPESLLTRIAGKHGVSTQAVLALSVSTLLQRYTQQQNIVVGADFRSVGDRDEPLILKSSLTREMTVTDALAQVAGALDQSAAHSSSRLSEILTHLGVTSEGSYHPVFQVLVADRRASADNSSSPYDLEFRASEKDRELQIVFASDLFEKATAGRILKHWTTVIESLASDATTSLAALEILPREEKQLILEKWTATDRDYPRDETLASLFSQQAIRRPQACALIDGTTRLTYAELHTRAMRIAAALKAEGVTPESLVGICVERSWRMVASIIGTLYAGAAYVPLDPAYPAERLGYILDDAKARVLIAEKKAASVFSGAFGCKTLLVEEDQFQWAAAAAESWQIQKVDPSAVAYVIYTSGSTGKPKGVAIEHRNAVALVWWAKDVFKPEELDGVLASTSMCFDLSIYEMFVPLCLGGKIVVAANALALPTLPARNEVRMINTVPSAIRELVRIKGIPESVTVVNLAGEPLPTPLVDDIYSNSRAKLVYDLYGPTETTTYSTFTLREPGKKATIGKPLANEQVYLLDADRRPVPVGVPGEIYIGGEKVARGYLNKPEMTADRFLANPFKPGTRFYRTGDLGKWRPDGNIEYLGRIDNQVKIRGFRIELGEIESVLKKSGDVADAVVMAREDRPGMKRLVAYAVAAPGKAATAEPLKAALREKLPEYMVPSVFVFLPKMPLTPNGKVNRKALPAPEADRSGAGGDLVAPSNSREELLAGIWREVLGLKEVGTRDNFFDLGGNSLIAIQVISRVRDQCGAELPLSALFNSPTIEQLAILIEGDRSVASHHAQEIPVLDRSRPIVASWVQELQWFLDQLTPGIDAYNVASAIRIKGPLDLHRLERASNIIISRHEPLRTTFSYVEGSVMQNIAPQLSIRLEEIRVEGPTAAEREVAAVDQANLFAQRAFNLALGPLIRIAVVRVNDNDHIFAVAIHHTVCDGWSLGVFFRELQTFYSSEDPRALPAFGLQYADVAAWKRNQLEGGALKKELDYWKKQLAGAPPATELPFDKQPAERTNKAAKRIIVLPLDQWNAANIRAKTSLFMTLIAALSVTLNKWTGQEDIVIGTVAGGRNRRDFENLIGCFMNFLPLRVRLRTSQRGADLLAEVRETVLQAQMHDECPFEKLVEEINPERKLDRNPLYNVALLLQNYAVDPFRTAELDSSPVPVDIQSALLDLRFEAEECAGGIALKCNYRTDLFEPQTVDRVLAAFAETFSALISAPDSPIEDYSLKALGESSSRASLQKAKETVAVTATFTAEPLNESLRYWTKELELRTRVEFAPYNQVFQQLLDPAGLIGRNKSGLNVLLIRLEDWSRSQHDHDASASLSRVEEESLVRNNAGQFVSALKGAVARTQTPWLISICPASPRITNDAGRNAFFSGVEEEIYSAVQNLAGVYVLTSAETKRWYPVANYYDAGGDDLGHVPYTPVYFTALGTGIMRKYHALKRPASKVIVLDCDNTLWSGVCGEDGAKGVRLEEAFLALQRFMRAQHDSGMLLCVCSKNNEADAREVFAQRLEMPLRREHFAAWRTNWKPKSENLKSLAHELKLGLDSFIFVDDNPVECAEVAANCPEVLTLQLPEDPAAFARFLEHCWAFDHLKLTSEDRQRAGMYRQNHEREQLRFESLSLADFVASLELNVVIGKMTPDHLPRVSQLTQRTNQFNFTTFRRTEAEIQALAATKEVLTVRVNDRFGDYGLTGVLIYSQRASALDVDTFLLSCRVLGRGVEHRMLARLGEIAQERRLNWVDVHFNTSKRNQPALDFLESVGSPFRQALNGGYLFRFPAGFAAEVAFDPQSAPAETVVGEKTPSESNNGAAAAGTPGRTASDRQQPVETGFRRCREIALTAFDPTSIHERIESGVKAQVTAQAKYVAPRNGVERDLCELWAKMLHLKQVGINDNFFDLGGHSLLAVRLFAEIEKMTGRKLPLVTLFQSPTIRQLAKALKPGNDDTSRSLLVPVQPNGDKPPLYLVHGAGGDVLWGYANLAGHMPADQPIYGIRSRGQTGHEEFHTLSEMAACYVREIRALQPQGPYYFGGYCFGGNVAYEMARQLRAQGQEVAFLALLDSAPTNVGYENPRWLSPAFHARFARNAAYWLCDFATLPMREQRRWVQRKAKAAVRKLLRRFARGNKPASVDLEDVIDPMHFPEQELKLWQAHLNALVRHVDGSYDGEVLLLRTRGQPIFCSLEDDFCWRALAPKLQICRIPGSHENIFMEPNVMALAEELTRWLPGQPSEGQESTHTAALLAT
jgi:amino acid adenylation domain-containing protein/FkbH-like protein